MAEYFTVSNSFAAPFFSDRGEAYVEADTPVLALEKYAAEYRHPCGPYSANCYRSADAFHKDEKHLAQWLCNRAIEEQRVTKDLSCYSAMGESPERFRINDTWYTVENPKGGKVVA
jgi:hypothetical protein